MAGRRQRPPTRDRPPAGQGHLRADRAGQDPGAPTTRSPPSSRARTRRAGAISAWPRARSGGAEGVIDAAIGRDPRSRAPHGGRCRRARASGRSRASGCSSASAPAPAPCRCRVPARDRAHPPDPRPPGLARPPAPGRRHLPGASGGAGGRPRLAELVAGLGGVALHAAGLAFAHPATGAPMDFSCPLPDRIERILSHLRNKAR